MENGCLQIIRIHPRLAVKCFDTLPAGVLLENLENRNGMLVAQSTAIAFVPTKTLGTWLTKGGERNALDDFCDSVGLWLLGVVSSYTVGGFIHILLVLALVVLLINIIGGRRTVV